MMTLKIDKKPHGVTVKLTHDASKKPVEVHLTNEQARALVAVLDTATRASVFTFEVTL